MTIKLTILTTEEELLGHEVLYKDGLWFIRTSSARILIPLYEFKCDKNLTTLLNDGIFNKTDEKQTG
jgi:hypothetical protein